jgi:hypothetical protein
MNTKQLTALPQFKITGIYTVISCRAGVQLAGSYSQVKKLNPHNPRLTEYTFYDRVKLCLISYMFSKRTLNICQYLRVSYPHLLHACSIHLETNANNRLLIGKPENELLLTN